MKRGFNASAKSIVLHQTEQFAQADMSHSFSLYGLQHTKRDIQTLAQNAQTNPRLHFKTTLDFVLR